MQIGDVVYLKSGSRPMTVVQIDTEEKVGEVATCSWDGGSQRFPAAALTTVDPLPDLQHAQAKAVAQKELDDPLPVKEVSTAEAIVK